MSHTYHVTMSSCRVVTWSSFVLGILLKKMELSGKMLETQAMSTQKNKQIMTLMMVVAICTFATQAMSAEIPITVDIYGQANLSVDYMDNANPSDSNAGESLYLSSNSSRLGFKGSANVAEGYDVIYQIECSVDLSEGSGTIAGRNSYVGFDTPYGRIIGGKYDTPFKSLATGNDLFMNRIGDNRNILGIGGAGFNLRSDDILVYTSPTYYNLTLVAGYVAEDGVNQADALSTSLSYKAEEVFQDGDCLSFGAGYEVHGKRLIGPAVAESESGVRLAATYKTGAWAFTGLTEWLYDTGGTKDADRNTFGGGAAYDLGCCIVKAQVYKCDGVDGTANSNAVMYVAGVDKKLSDDTTIYAAYALMENQAGSTLAMAGGGHGDNVTPASGGDPSGFSLGIIHKF